MKEIHPIGKAPIITDGDTALAESGAIVEYIVRRHAGGRLGVEPQSPDYARYTYWMHFAEGSLMSLMLIALVLSRVPEAKDTRHVFGREAGSIEAKPAKLPHADPCVLCQFLHGCGAAALDLPCCRAFHRTSRRQSVQARSEVRLQPCDCLPNGACFPHLLLELAGHASPK